MSTIKSTQYDQQYQNYYELIMATMKLEERITGECIEDELTGVYLIDKNKLDSIVNDLKEKIPPVCSMPVVKSTENQQRTLNELIKRLINKNKPT